jgi:hypothetical protein
VATIKSASMPPRKKVCDEYTLAEDSPRSGISVAAGLALILAAAQSSVPSIRSMAVSTMNNDGPIQDDPESSFSSRLSQQACNTAEDSDGDHHPDLSQDDALLGDGKLSYHFLGHISLKSTNNL